MYRLKAQRVNCSRVSVSVSAPLCLCLVERRPNLNILAHERHSYTSMVDWALKIKSLCVALSLSVSVCLRHCVSVCLSLCLRLSVPFFLVRRRILFHILSPNTSSCCCCSLDSVFSSLIFFLITSCPNGLFSPWEIRVASPPLPNHS